MMILTSLQRDFLDRYYTEYMNLEAGPAVRLGSQHGFFYEHLRALFDIYCQSWGGDLSIWGASHPPLSPGRDPLVFPWSSIQALEEELRGEGISIKPIPRVQADADRAGAAGNLETHAV
jgi:hypothetical protein